MCEDDLVIDKWLQKKRIMLRAINTKIDLRDFGENPTRQNEIYLPSLPLAAGKFSDARFRLRRNLFIRNDWYISSFIE